MANKFRFITIAVMAVIATARRRVGAMAAAGPSPMVWHDFVPPDLAPWRGQFLVCTGTESWDNITYAHLDWIDAGGQLRCRYCAWVEICWNPSGRWPWPPLLLPPASEVLEVMEAKWHPKKFSLVQLESRPHVVTRLLWRVQLWGCYAAATAADR